MPWRGFCVGCTRPARPQHCSKAIVHRKPSMQIKGRNPYTSGQAGSEYRVAIAALMLANKFVDE